MLGADQEQMAMGCATARGFYERAVAFSRAAELVHASDVVDPHPKYFLWGRATELFLKSFLLSENVPLSKSEPSTA